MGSNRPRVLLGVTGSVATLKAYEIANGLSQFCEVIIITTKPAQHFLERIRNYNPESQRDFDNREDPIKVLTDEDEWKHWDKVGDSVEHIRLREWADLMIIAPLSANTLAKLANGLSDNLLTCICRAWNTKKPLIVAPAMNTLMWNHPFTRKHLHTLEELGMEIIDPVSRVLACGDEGKGALAHVKDILAAVHKALDPQTGDEVKG